MDKMKRPYCGIYKITFNDDSFYIGATLGRFKKRFKNHESQMKTNSVMKLLADKYKEVGMPKFRVLCTVNNHKDLLPIEAQYIKLLKPVLNARYPK